METAVVYTGFMAFVTEMFAPLLLCSSIPLGSPPVQDPNLGRIAPKQCVFYVGWAGMGTPDAKSHNSAERFLADPEIRHMRAEAARRFRLLMKAAPASANDASSTFTIGPCNIPPQFSADAEFWCELLVTRPCAGFISHLTQGDNSPDPHGGFVMNVGDARLRVAAMLKRYRGLAKDIIEERTVDGATEYRLKTTSPPAHDDSRDSNGQAAQGPRAGQDLFLVSDGNKPRSASAPTTAAAKNLKPTTNAASKPATAEPAGLPIRWSLRGKYLIITCGDESPAKTAKRMRGAEPEWFAAVGKNLSIERRAAVARFDLDALAAPFAKGDAAQQETAKQIKQTHVHAVTLVTGLGHNDFVSQLLVETDGVARALLKTMVDRPLKTADLAVIPRDASLAMAFRVNPHLIATGCQCLDAQAKQAGKTTDANPQKNANPPDGKSEDAKTPSTALDVQNFLMLMAQSPGETARGAITRFCRKPIVVDLDDEICAEMAASLGDAWRLYTSPGEGSSIFNGMTGVVQVKDARRLAKLFDKLAARKPGDCPNFRASENGTVPLIAGKPAGKAAAKAADKSPNDDAKSNAWAVRKTRFADHDVYYLVRTQGETAGVLTWCVVKRELVWSLSPQNVKAYLLRQPGGPTLADEPAVIDALRGKQSPTLLMYEDSRRMFNLTYPLMQGYAGLVAAQCDLPSDGIDPMLLPAGPTIAKYLHPAVSTVSVAPKGVQLTMHQSLPNGNLGATLYCLLCSLLPANSEGFMPTAGMPMIMPAYEADPVRHTENLYTTDGNAAAKPDGKSDHPFRQHGSLDYHPFRQHASLECANDGNNPASPGGRNDHSGPACVPSDATQRECASSQSTCPPPTVSIAAPVPTAAPLQRAAAPSGAPPSGYAPCPAAAAATYGSPLPVYPATATPTPYSPTAAASASPSAANAVCPYTVSGYDSSAGGYSGTVGHGAPIANGPWPYAIPWGPATPQNPGPPQAWSPTSPYSSASPAPQGYQRIVINVPVVIYVPVVATPSGNPPTTRLPAADPSPGYPPAGYVSPYAAPGYAPSGYAPPANTAPDYVPRSAPYSPRYTPPPTGCDPYPPTVAPPAAQGSDPVFDTLMGIAAAKIAQGESAEVGPPLRRLLCSPRLSAKQRLQVTALLERVDSESTKPAVPRCMPPPTWTPPGYPPTPAVAPPTYAPPTGAVTGR